MVVESNGQPSSVTINHDTAPCHGDIDVEQEVVLEAREMKLGHPCQSAKSAAFQAHLRVEHHFSINSWHIAAYQPDPATCSL